MKTLLGCLFIILLGNSVSAAVKWPKVSLFLRMDAAKYFSNDKTKLLGNGKELKYEIPYIRLNMKGDIGHNMLLHLKYRLNDTLAKEANGDKSGKGLNIAYIDKKITPNFKLKIGKQFLLHGGWEGTLSSKEWYSSSVNNFVMFGVGIGAFYKIAGQNFIFQTLNNRNDLTNQSTPLYGFNWSSSFFGEMINPIISYHVEPFENNNTTITENGNKTYIAIGNRLKIADFFVDVDYRINKSDGTIVNGKSSENKGFVARVSYQKGLWRPAIKYAKIKEETLNTGVYSGDDIDYHAVIEYFPTGNPNFRYHLAYIMSEDHLQKNSTVVKNSSVKLGIAGIF